MTENFGCMRYVAMIGVNIDVNSLRSNSSKTDIDNNRKSSQEC